MTCEHVGGPSFVARETTEVFGINDAVKIAKMQTCLNVPIANVPYYVETTNHRMHGSGGGQPVLDSTSTPAAP
jgi:hypothetical protein